jgi:hypothetical protein
MRSAEHDLQGVSSLVFEKGHISRAHRLRFLNGVNESLRGGRELMANPGH